MSSFNEIVGTIYTDSITSPSPSWIISCWGLEWMSFVQISWGRRQLLKLLCGMHFEKCTGKEK